MLFNYSLTMNDTLHFFALRDLPLIMLVSIGFLGTIWGITYANSNMEQREHALKNAKKTIEDKQSK